MAVQLGARRMVSCFLRGVSRQPKGQRPASVQLRSMAAVVAQPPRSFIGDGDFSWKSFVDGGKEGVSEAVVLEGGRRVKLTWLDGHESEFSLKWLRDHSNASFNVNTKQRELDTFSISNDTPATHASVETMSSAAPCSSTANPSMATANHSQQVLRLRWEADGNADEDEECTVPIERLRQHCSSETARSLRQKFGKTDEVAKPDPTPVLWGKGVLSSAIGTSPPHFEYTAIMEDDQHSSPAKSISSPPSPQGATSQLIDRLISHGIVLVKGVPTDVPGTEGLGLKLGRHLMGTSSGKNGWSVSTGAADTDYSLIDTAYTRKSLGLHTDCVFLSEPPGLEVFNCQVQASEGGAGIYVDGFAVAERLRKEKPEAFEFFTKTSLTYQSFDAGYFYVAHGPIFRMNPHGFVDQVRHNDYHRAPLDYLSTDDIDRFYEYHKPLSAIMRDPAMVERILLEPGDTVIFNNHRALHGRESYKGSRVMVGCYVGMDEVDSEVRMRGI